ncbi:MAG: murein biosynthesis integral membrane protein MurJ [Anaerolineae bacterium]
MAKPANTTTIARAATLVMVFFAASRALGLARDVVIASQFGTNPDYEAYLAAFRLPDLLFNVVSGGALGSAFIPTFTGYLARRDQAGAWRLASAIINWVLLMLVALGLLAGLFAPQLVRTVIAPGFADPAQQALAAALMRWLMVSTVVFGVSGLLMGILNAHQHFLLPALAPVVYNLAIIGGAWFLGPRWGVFGLAAGVVLGALGHLAVQLPGVVRYGMRFQWLLAPGDPGVRQVARLMGPRVLGLAAVQLNFVWDTILASGLSSGSLAGLDYGRRLMLLPQGIIAQAVAAAAFPTFSALAAQKKWDELQHALTVTLRSILYITVPATIGLMLLAGPVVRLLYQRNAFDQASTRAVMWSLWFYTLGLVAHSMVEILTRAFYALHNTKTPVLVGVVSMGVNMLLSLLLLNLFAGLALAPHGGIALASSLAVGLEMVWLAAALRRQPGGLSVRGLGRPLARIAFSGVVMAGALGLFLRVWGAASPWVIAPGGIALGGAVYGAVSFALGAEEPALVWQTLRRRAAR